MTKVLHPYIALFVAACCTLSSAQAQRCGTPPPTPEQYAFTRDVISHIDVESLRNAGTTCIPIQAHVVRDAAGAGGPTQLDMNKGLSYLNEQYLAAGIEFFWKGAPDVVNNADYYTFDQTAPDSDTETALVALFTTATDAINMYYVGSITTSTGFSAGGYAYFPANQASTNRMVIRTDQVVLGGRTGVFPHEMGHFFNLYHTFEGTSSGPTSSNAENVARSGAQSNCSAKGDLLCDTQADPGADDANISGCTYIGTQMDQFSVLYTPPIENPMSYWPSQCGTTFTASQYTRIMQGLVTRQSHTTYNFSATPQTVTAASGLTASLVNGAVQLTWTDNAANDMGYLIERSTTSASAGFKALDDGATTTSATTWSDPTVQSNTTYWYRVKASNGSCNTYSNVATVALGLVYCTPAYYQTCAGGTNVIIDRFALTASTSINNSDSNCSPNGFGDYTAQNANVTAGSTYAVIISALVGAGSYFPSQGQIWIDANHDGDFEDAGEKLLATAGTMEPTFTGNITIPAGALNGATRLRVRCWDTGNGCNPTSCSQCAFGETEDYTVTVSGGVSPIVQLNVTVMLQGPYLSGSMTDGLRTSSLIPTTEPYAALGYTHVGGGGGETTTAGVLATSGTTAVVDWVVIELRNSATPATVVATKSALLRRNGTVVSGAGTSPLTFNVPAGSYYVAVHHRNHLGVMTASAVALSGTATLVDFSSMATLCYGTNARFVTAENLGALWMGNVFNDTKLSYTGTNNDRDPILTVIGSTVPTNTVSGYRQEDVNLDGTVRYTGTSNDRDGILINVGSTVPTNTRQQQLP